MATVAATGRGKGQHSRRWGIEGHAILLLWALVMLSPALAVSVSSAQTVTPCGGENQRACCVLEESFGACRPGLVEIPKANAGQCARALPGIQSSGVCVKLTACGGENERACCV